MSKPSHYSRCLRWFLENDWSVEVWRDQYDTFTCMISKENRLFTHTDRRWRKAISGVYRVMTENPY